MTALGWVAVAGLGGVGAVARALVDDAVSGRVGRAFPWGILVVNVSGAVLLGLVTGLALGHDAALLAGTATVGSYTTFSTWVLDTERLGEGRRGWAAAANVGASLVLGVAAAALGRQLGGLF